jgi:ribosomal protein S18 acetylase RimI-like enzyme
MTVEPFRTEDIAAFLKLAAAENWLVEEWEFVFLLKRFPEGCFCVRDDSGAGIAFVTSLPHGQSGWIGNLIVAPEFRGKGVGEALFRKARETLHAAGVRTFWLTASSSGKSLYEKHGFTGIDSIYRWSGNGRQRHSEMTSQVNTGATTDPVNSIDQQVWGDRREMLLSATTRRGRLLLDEAGFVVVQPCGIALQIGPFSALDSATAEALFEAALRTIPLGTKVFLDAPASNRSGLRLFNRKGMRVAGRTELMYSGVKPKFQPDLLYGLATLGSSG